MCAEGAENGSMRTSGHAGGGTRSRVCEKARKERERKRERGRVSDKGRVEDTGKRPGPPSCFPEKQSSETGEPD